MPWLRLHHVFALAVWDGRVYWSDWETRAIESCRRRPLPPGALPAASNTTGALPAANSTSGALPASNSTGGAYDCRTLVHTVHKPMDLRVYHPARQPPAPGNWLHLLSPYVEALQCIF